MALTLDNLKDEITIYEDYKDLDQKAWETKIEYRDITHRSQKDFDWLKPMYVKKIDAIRKELAGPIVVPVDEGMTKAEYAEQVAEHTAYLETKLVRLFDKLAVVLKEEELRKDPDFLATRVAGGIHDQTDYFIDYDNGNDGSAGTATGTAWKTITKYTTTTVRTPGDVAYLRANITWDQGTEATDIILDEDGTVDDYISIIGCDATTNDPWSDASDVKPVLDFQSGSYQLLSSADHFWYFSNFAVTGSADTSGSFSISSHDIVVEDCDFYSMTNSSSEGVRILSTCISLINCTFENCYQYAIYFNGAINSRIIGCTITAGAGVGTGVGLYIDNSNVYVSDSTLTGSFDTAEVVLNKGLIYMRNIDWSEDYTLSSIQYTSKIYIEDSGQVYGTHKYIEVAGVISKETASPRSGGSTSYAKIQPNTYCGTNNPLILGDTMSGFSAVWLTKDVEYTITVYARTGSAWDSALSASEAFLRASYLSNGASAARTEIDSTETITNDANWTAFTVTITPLQTGFVYLWFYLAEYEDATEYIDVDIKPVVT